MMLILAGEKDVCRSPLPEIKNAVGRSFEVKLVELRPPSEVVFEEEIRRIEEKSESFDVAVGYCFGGNYLMQLDGFEKLVVVDPPEGIEDSEGNKLGRSFLGNISVIGSSCLESSGIPDGVDQKYFETDHWFSGKDQELVEVVLKEFS